MAKNTSYFIGNGTTAETDILNILHEGEIRRDFADISTLDLATLNIKKNAAKEVLREFNKDKRLNGDFIDVSISNKELLSDAENKRMTIYPTIFNLDDEKTKVPLDYLRYFAEQRDYKFRNGLNVALDQNQKFYDFIDYIMPRLTGKTKQYITAENSMLSKNAKETIRKGFYGVDYARSRQLRNICASYTQLRILLYEYLLILEEQNPLLRQFYKRFENAKFNGMDIVQPIPYVEEKEEEETPIVISDCDCYQMDLTSFINDPNLSREVYINEKTRKLTKKRRN